MLLARFRLSAAEPKPKEELLRLEAVMMLSAPSKALALTVVRVFARVAESVPLVPTRVAEVPVVVVVKAKVFAKKKTSH